MRFGKAMRFLQKKRPYENDVFEIGGLLSTKKMVLIVGISISSGYFKYFLNFYWTADLWGKFSQLGTNPPCGECSEKLRTALN